MSRLIHICAPGQEGPHCGCSFCAGMKAVLAERRRRKERAVRLTRIILGISAAVLVAIYFGGR